MPKPIAELLIALARPDVTEFALMGGRLPCVKIGESYKPVDDYPPTNEEIIDWMTNFGGAEHAQTLGATPVRFSMHVVHVGPVKVSAVKRNDVVQVRMHRGEGAIAPAPPVPAGAPRKADGSGLATPAPAMSPLLGIAGLAGAAIAGGPVAKQPGKGVEIDFDASQPLELDDARKPKAKPPTPTPLEVKPDAHGQPHGHGHAKPPPAARGHAPAQPASAYATTPGIAPAHLPAVAPPLATPAPAPAAPAPPPPEKPAWKRPKTHDAFESLLADAREASASDLHLVADRPPLFRIAGDLLPRGETLSPSALEKLVSPRLSPRLREMLEKTGSCDFALQLPDLGRFRINVSRQRTGLKACMRLISDEIPTLASLGLPEAIAAATHHHQGLIVVTGPTGHGKTSTLAAIVDIINRETTHHVITVEDPVEYLHPRKKAMISQREVGTHTKTFASALKGSLRQDPDVIVVGELRDTETVRMALSASETGHLVVATMNTPSAAKTIDRLIDLFPPGDQPQVRLTLAGGLRLVVSQRLLPNATRTGLVAAAELLPGSIALWNLIRDNKTFQIPSLQQRGKALGIIRLDDSLAELVRSGRTTIEEARGWAEAPELFEALVKGEGLMPKTPEAAVKKEAAAPGQKPEGKGIEGVAGGLFQKAGNLFKKGS